MADTLAAASARLRTAAQALACTVSVSYRRRLLKRLHAEEHRYALMALGMSEADADAAVAFLADPVVPDA